MSLSRKRKKELKRLKKEANKLWSSQQEVIDRANVIARDAGNQLSHYSREQLVPAVVDTYEARVQPVVDRGQKLASSAKKGIDKKVLPAVGGAIGTILSVGDIANDKRVSSALERAGKKVKKATGAKTGPSVGGIIAIGVGVLAVGAVGYAVWQTFRADDELWVADDEPTLPNA